MKSELEIFREYIRQRGLRRTPERELILAEIFATHEHFDVDSLYLSLRQKGVKVSKASIYRALPLFIDCGLIREVDFTDGHWHYEHIYGHEQHHHLRCLACGEVLEFAEPGLSCLGLRLLQEYGFTVVSHHLDVKGYCRSCREPEAPPAAPEKETP
ncbi:MAG: transcriptional repressor [Desulfobaccales bacterium]